MHNTVTRNTATVALALTLTSFVLVSCSEPRFYDDYFSEPATARDTVPDQVISDLTLESESVRYLGREFEQDLYLAKEDGASRVCLVLNEIEPDEWFTFCGEPEATFGSKWNGVEYLLSPDEPQEDNFTELKPHIYIKPIWK